jgi:hypothetical protein
LPQREGLPEIYVILYSTSLALGFGMLFISIIASMVGMCVWLGVGGEMDGWMDGWMVMCSDVHVCVCACIQARLTPTVIHTDANTTNRPS